MRRPRAVIAGAGIGGLAAALALRRAGLEVQVLERTRDLREIGAALLLWPNGTAALRTLGVEVRTLDVRRFSMRDRHDRVITEAPVDRLAERFGSAMTVVHRADLQAGLRRALGEDAIRLDSEVIGFADGEAAVDVRLRGRETVEADLLVGADGLRSAVRRQLLGDGDPDYLGATVWRGVVDAGGLAVEPAQGINWVGRGAEFLALHVAGGRVYWAGVTKEPEGSGAGPGGHRADLTRRFGDWPEPVPGLISATDEDAILRNDMYDRKPVASWSRGRVTLLGDAAHPMTPNAGQGACQALEDAIALGDSFSRSPDPALALPDYERRRLRRANWVVRMSHRTSRVVQMENPLLCALRDGATRLLMRPSLQLRMMEATLMPAAR